MQNKHKNLYMIPNNYLSPFFTMRGTVSVLAFFKKYVLQAGGKVILMIPLLFFVLSVSACRTSLKSSAVDYRGEMRKFVVSIARAARLSSPSFAVIPQNGQELIERADKDADISAVGELDGSDIESYMDAVSGTGREDLYFGYEDDDKATPEAVSSYMKNFCDAFRAAGKKVFVIDYCSAPSFIDFSYAQNYKNGYISFAADERNLTSVPAYPGAPFNENGDAVLSVADAKNFLYLINPERFSSKEDFIAALCKTNYDMFIVDLFCADEKLDFSDVQRLKVKPNGARRQVICYMSIGEAETYRYYWNESWKRSKPEWLKKENPLWKGNYKVAYWHPEWQNIIFGTEDSYLQKIVDAGFDGVYLDIIDAFEYFENGQKE